MPLATSKHERIHRFTVAMQATTRLVDWRPTAWSIAIGTSLLATARPASLDLRLALSGALVASSYGFLLDDDASPTIEPVPTALRTRRLQRIAIGAVPVGLWWVTAVSFVTVRTGGSPLTGRTLLFTTLAATALVTSAFATRHGDRTSGGVAGAVTTLLVFAATLLPNHTWLPLPPAADAPNATLELTALLTAALTMLWLESRDPATRTQRAPR